MPPPARASSIELAGITGVVVPPFPCPDDSVRIAFSTCACGERFTAAFLTADGHVRLEVSADPTIVCITCDSLAATVELGRFAAGLHSFPVDVVIQYGRDGQVDSSRTFSGLIGFTVRPDCTPPLPIPNLGRVQVGGSAPCTACTPLICAGDSIPVYLSGLFPDGSWSVDEIRVVPSMAASPLPQPDTVQLYYGRACGGALVLVPWSARAKIGALPANPYTLRVEGYTIDHCHGDSIQSVGVAGIPFTVTDSCDTIPPPPPPPGGCFTVAFPHAPGSSCDAPIGANQPAAVTLGVRTGVALAGLQGRFAFDVPGLVVTGLEAVGPASGMLLSWQPTPDGARFVLVATSGAPIGPTPPDSLGHSDPASVLRVHVAVAPGAEVPDQARLMPLEFVASDVNGVSVPYCIARMTDVPTPDPAAHFCRASGCDFNGDGAVDVRDLVVMAHCILDPSGACPAGASDHLDCNGDGVKDVGDVLCCARILLGGLPQPGDGSGRPAPDVKVTLGRPRATAAGVDVPVTLAGLAGVGAARVDFEYPDTRYDVASVEFGNDPDGGGGTAGWLTLDQANAGALTLGLVALGANPSPTIPLVVHLALRAGAPAGGSFGVTGGDFAGTDGAALTTTIAHASTPLAGGGGFLLTAPRPNPFASETRFSITLAQPADVDVAIFDLLGRRVTTLFHGRALAGTTDFAWDRTRADGARVGTGVYFVRVAAGGAVAGRKVLVLSRDLP